MRYMNRGSISCVSIGSEHALHFWRSPRSLYVLGMLTLPSVDGTSMVKSENHTTDRYPFHTVSQTTGVTYLVVM
jgi:hypothetical protein